MSREPDERRMRLIEEKLGINNNHLFQFSEIFHLLRQQQRNDGKI